MQLKVKVQAFGIVKDIFGASCIEISPEGVTVSELKAQLERDYPKLKALASFLIAKNNEYAEGSDQINVNDEIAIIPPVSGG